MSKKCECCRHFQLSRPKGHFNDGTCRNSTVVDEGSLFTGTRTSLPILKAREICDREGDGRFVHFDPKDDTAGGACFVQITREPITKAMAAGGRA